MTSTNKINCEVCHNFDEFSICGKCLSKYSQNTTNLRKSLESEKYYLKSAIQEIIGKHHHNLVTGNKLLLRKLRIEKLNELILRNQVNLKIKQNLLIHLNDKIRAKKESLVTLKEKLKTMKDFQKDKSSLGCLHERLSLYKNNYENIKSFFFKFITEFCVTEFIQIEDFFEICEFIKPDEKIGCEIKDFNSLPNILSVTNTRTLNQKEYVIFYEKQIKIKSSILANPFLIMKLNSFLYSLSFIQVNLSKILNFFLPYPINLNLMEVENNHSNKKFRLFLDFTEHRKDINILNEIVMGCIYLDINLKTLLYCFKYDGKPQSNYMSSSEYFSNPDLKSFLKFKENQRIEGKTKSNNYLCINNKSVQIDKLREDDGFILIENYFIK